MRMKRCTRAIIAAFLLLTGIAFIIDKPGLLAASFSLWVLIICRYLLFFARIRPLAGSVQIARSMDKTLIRQGMSCQVNTLVTMKTGEEKSRIYRVNSNRNDP